jgi:hypothetical protein
MRKIPYDFTEIIKIEGEEKKPLERPNFRIIKCCGNCKYAWFKHSNERRGFCRFGQKHKKAPNRNTPNPEWAHLHIHATCVCDNHVDKPKGFFKENVSKWVNIVFDVLGRQIEDDVGKKHN